MDAVNFLYNFYTSADKKMDNKSEIDDEEMEDALLLEEQRVALRNYKN